MQKCLINLSSNISNFAKNLNGILVFYETAIIKTSAFLVGICTGAYFSKYIKRYAWLLGLIGVLIAIPTVIKIIKNFLED